MTNESPNLLVPALQIVERCSARREADALAESMRAQEGCMGARVIDCNGSFAGRSIGAGYKVQAFFPPLPEGAGCPDGCLRVSVPASMLAALHAA